VIILTNSKTMAYNKFKKLNQLATDFGIVYENTPFLPSINPIEASLRLLEDLQDASAIALTTEKAKSEHIVVPILKEFLRKHINQISYFSGFEFNVDSEKKLTGYCDFILSLKPRQLEIISPVFCLVEAKNAEIEKGLAQCGAEMYAAYIFNEKEGNPKKQIFGCVTNAFSWCFLKLENKNLYIDPNYVPLTFTEPHRVLGVLQWILDESLKPYQS
jgi:hypothetical protein